MEKTLMHTALFAEAKPLIEHFKMQCLQKKPYYIFAKDDMILIISGIGAKNTSILKEVFNKYQIKKAINIGIAGCKDKNTQIGKLFCTNHKLNFIKFATLSSVDKSVNNTKEIDTMLVDMEAQSFLQICEKQLDLKDIYILKVVSDHLETKIPKKEFVWNIIEKNLQNISKIVNLKD
ncbi:MAG: nucleoside phosphorylase [Campylobacteraceae bacterium]|nr:nucleoside phosphorylase [Campylobacteraceae bacterium]